MPILMKAVRVQGIYVGSRAMFENMNRAIAIHKLRPVIDRVYPMDEVVEAHRYVETWHKAGNVVLTIP